MISSSDMRFNGTIVRFVKFVGVSTIGISAAFSTSSGPALRVARPAVSRSFCASMRKVSAKLADVEQANKVKSCSFHCFFLKQVHSRSQSCMVTCTDIACLSSIIFLHHTQALHNHWSRNFQGHWEGTRTLVSASWVLRGRT